MSKSLSAKYYQENKERLQKKARETFQGAGHFLRKYLKHFQRRLF